MALDQRDEVRRGVAGQRRTGEARIGGQEALGPDITVGEVAAPAAGNQDLLARRLRMIEQEDAAATLPGATLVPHATNVAGRAGIGIMWTSKTARQVYKNEWIFDKTTLRFIGEKTYDPGTGRLTGESAIIQQTFTAKAGQRP